MAGLVLLAILAFIVAPALQIAGGMRPRKVTESSFAGKAAE